MDGNLDQEEDASLEVVHQTAYGGNLVPEDSLVAGTLDLVEDHMEGSMDAVDVADNKTAGHVALEAHQEEMTVLGNAPEA